MTQIHWDWYQRTGPGVEVLGNPTRCTIADLGAGTGRQAAYIAQNHQPAEVIAIDSSPSQSERARNLYGHIPGLTFIEADATDYLQQHPSSLDMCYSAFGALDFTDPRTLLPAIATSLRPGGILVIATLAHTRDGRPAAGEVRPTNHSFLDQDGNPKAIAWWVLSPPVWAGLLTATGFIHHSTQEIRDPGTTTEPPMAVNLIRATRKAR